MMHNALNKTQLITITSNIEEKNPMNYYDW